MAPTSTHLHLAPQDFHLTRVSSEISAVTSEPSQDSVLWAELIKEKERVFLKAHLKTEKVCVTIHDTFQVYVRVCWQRGDEGSGLDSQGMDYARRRPGPAVLCLHSVQGLATSSWVWLKFVKSFHDAGFHSVLVDLPGCGRSAMGQDPFVPWPRWRRDDWHMLQELLEEMGLLSVSSLSQGASCMSILRLLSRSPRALQSTHVFVDPIFDDHLWGELGDDQLKFNDLLRRRGVRIWAVFQEEVFSRLEVSAQVAEQRLLAAREAELPITVSRLPREKLCEAQLGAQVPVRALFAERRLKRQIVDFFKGKRAPVLRSEAWAGAASQSSSGCQTGQLMPSPAYGTGSPPKRRAGWVAPGELDDDAARQDHHSIKNNAAAPVGAAAAEAERISTTCLFQGEPRARAAVPLEALPLDLQSASSIPRPSSSPAAARTGRIWKLPDGWLPGHRASPQESRRSSYADARASAGHRTSRGQSAGLGVSSGSKSTPSLAEAAGGSKDPDSNNWRLATIERSAGQAGKAAYHPDVHRKRLLTRQTVQSAIESRQATERSKSTIGAEGSKLLPEELKWIEKALEESRREHQAELQQRAAQDQELKAVLDSQEDLSAGALRIRDARSRRSRRHL